MNSIESEQISSTYPSASDFAQSNARTLLNFDEPLNHNEKHKGLSWDAAQENENIRISTRANFFNLGGDSLLLIQLYRHYQLLFGFDNEALPIRPFFDQNTIVEHAKILETVVKNDKQLQQWRTLHITQGNSF